MTGNSDDDLRALRQMLPVPPDRDFLPGRRHVREEHLMTSWMSLNRRNQPRRLATRIATSVAVSAAAVGAFAAVSAYSGHSTAHPAVAKGAAPAGGAVAGTEISTVAYTLTMQPDHLVHIVVHPSAAVNPAEFEADLAKLGIHATASTMTVDQVKHAKAHVGEGWDQAQRQSDGDYETTVSPGADELIHFAEANPDQDLYLMVTPNK